MKKNNLSSAFSYVEVLVSLFIISMISIVLAVSYSVGIKAVVKDKESVFSSYKHMKVDSFLRKNIEKIEFPYWINELLLDAEDNILTISCNNVTYTIKLPEYVSIKKVEQLYPDGLAGVKISYEIGNKTYKSSVLFSSYSYGA
ncbi:MAG: type II secretion system protein, partial [Treponema sp.]|nr:type II secretion system protein [Treponema sp.]